MFETLTDKLQRAFKTLRGQGTLTEVNIAEALGLIRVALLEADVNLNVVTELIEQIRVKAVGTEVLTALSPSEQVIKIVRDIQVDVRFEQGHADFAQSFSDVFFGKRALAAEGLEGTL